MIQIKILTYFIVLAKSILNLQDNITTRNIHQTVELPTTSTRIGKTPNYIINKSLSNNSLRLRDLNTTSSITSITTNTSSLEMPMVMVPITTLSHNPTKTNTRIVSNMARAIITAATSAVVNVVATLIEEVVPTTVLKEVTTTTRVAKGSSNINLKTSTKTTSKVKCKCPSLLCPTSP